jgi:hypothetical protein
LNYWKANEKNLSYLRRWSMKLILSLKRHHYLAIVSIFLVTVALITGMAGCTVKYSIIISSTEGGTVTTPGEGTFTYDEGTVVNLVAQPDVGYRFANWAFNVDTIADAYAASTTITMNNHYKIIARFDN